MIIESQALNTVEKKRHERVSRRLQRLLNEDMKFQVEFKNIFDYYQSKIIKIIHNKGFMNNQVEALFDYIADLLYQGYYIGVEMLEHAEVQFADRFFRQPNGVMKEQVYDLLEGVTGNLIATVSHEDGRKFEKQLLDENKDVERLLVQIKKDITCLGTVQALIDERQKRNLSVINELDEYSGMLHRADDLMFVDPQKYLICTSTNGQSEQWELNLWSTVPTKQRKLGEVHVSVYEPVAINKNIQHLPYYQGFEGIQRQEKTVSVIFVCNEKVDEKDRLPIVSVIIESLSQRLQIAKEHISVTLAATSEYSNYQYSEEVDETGILA